MIYLYIYLGIGLLFWARGRFGSEFLLKRDWTELRRNKPAVKHRQERQWVEWAGGAVIHIFFWPVLAALLLIIVAHEATGWLLGKIAG